MKKFLASLLALVMLMALAAPALAEETVRGALRAAGYDTALKTAPPAELLAVYPEDTYAESNAHMCGKA